MKDFEDYVCTAEQAKKIKELGIEQDSLFYWWSIYKERPALYNELRKMSADLLKIEDYNYIVKEDDYIDHDEESLELYHYADHKDNSYSAFTSQELFELISLNTKEWSQGFDDKGDTFHFYYGERGASYREKDKGIEYYASGWAQYQEAQARGEFFIHLLEQKRGKQCAE
jgi:hypothetical protein